MCQCRFINCNKCTSLVGNVSGEGCAGGETEDIGGSLNFLLTPCCESKTIFILKLLF